MDQQANPLPTIGAYDAKSRLSELLDWVEKGEQIVITRHGKPIARLVPEGRPDRSAALAALDALTAYRADLEAQGVRLTTEEILGLRDEGRR
jgi:prevent-host-death family protein